MIPYPAQSRQPVIPYPAQSRQPVSQQPAIQQRSGSRTLTPEKLAKLRSQLDVVQGNIQVMSEMLIVVTPGEESSDDRDLLTVSLFRVVFRNILCIFMAVITLQNLYSDESWIILRLTFCFVFKELNRTCRAMQTRIVQLLDQVGSEEVTEELLRVNDDLNNVFIRYDRYERNREGMTQTRPEASTQPSQVR